MQINIVWAYGGIGYVSNPAPVHHVDEVRKTEMAAIAGDAGMSAENDIVADGLFVR